jgi:hypothetical protein
VHEKQLDISKLRAPALLICQRYLLRSALDALGWYRDLHDRKREISQSSRAILDALASDLEFAPEVLMYILRGIGEDPATEFLDDMLSSDAKVAVDSRPQERNDAPMAKPRTPAMSASTTA